MATFGWIIVSVLWATLSFSPSNCDDGYKKTDKSSGFQMPSVGWPSAESVGPIFENLAKSGIGPLMNGFSLQKPNDKKSEKIAPKKEEPFESIMNMFIPKFLTTTIPPTTTTTTTTKSPLVHLSDTIEDTNLPGSKILGGSAKALNNVVSSSLDLTGVKGGLVGPAAPEVVLKSVTESVGQVFNNLAGAVMTAKPESLQAYYEYGPDSEHRPPRYFSKECNFRIACEVGKLMKPYTTPMQALARNNKLIQDLQNRYTRAMTWGMLNNECDRYYCLFVQLMGGPKQFAGGMAEIINRMANPEMYDK